MFKKIDDFEPFPGMDHYLAQTIFGSYFNFERAARSQQDFVQLPDGDKLALQIATPQHWKATDLTVVFVHGLCGSENSAYLIRMTNRVVQQGFRAVRMNMRGCGSGKGHAKQFYHCGSSMDVFHALFHLREKTPLSPVILIGFSLGGHLVLKMAGDLKEQAMQFVDGLIAVSPPVNLLSSVQLLSHPDNRLFENYFSKLLIDNICYLQKKFPEIEPFTFPEQMPLMEFDEQYVAPRLGYKGAFDYYEKCSSLPLLSDLHVKTKILLALDDPIISPADVHEVKLPDHVEVYQTRGGGHLGFLGKPRQGYGFRWMDGILMEWIGKFWKEIKAKSS